jgi:hypothetical protein
MVTTEEDGGFWPNLEFATHKFNTKADEVFTMDSRSLIENAR